MRGLVFVVCVACGAKEAPKVTTRPQPVAPAVDAAAPELEPGPLPAEVPAADEVLATVRAGYAEAPTYVDHGVVKSVFSTGHTDELTFTTAFERGGRFRFEYRSADQAQRYIIWTDGSKTVSSWTVQPGLQTWPALVHALAAAAGVSSGTSIQIPRLLLPRDVTGRSLADRKVRIAGLDRVDGHPCWRLVVEDLPTRPTSRTLEETIWIDQQLHLVRRLFERVELTSDGKPPFEVSQTTRFTPVVTERIAPALLEPPGQ